MIDYLDNSSEKKDFIYGTNNFHHVWEQLVDFVYGEKDKEKFYPKVYWRLNGSSKAFEFDSEKRSSLRPDTIMITNRGNQNQKIFVLDSKYYRYGATKNPNHLPDSSSVVKQLAYAEYIVFRLIMFFPRILKKPENLTTKSTAFFWTRAQSCTATSPATDN